MTTTTSSSGLRQLIGSGGKIWGFTLPFLAVGLALNLAWPEPFGVGGPAPVLVAVSWVGVAVGLVGYGWSLLLVLARVPRGELITTGPYRLVRHPLYTAVSLLVAPSVGFLLDTWLGAMVGVAMYAGSRIFAREEEAALAQRFGPAWQRYVSTVRLPWL